MTSVFLLSSSNKPELNIEILNSVIDEYDRYLNSLLGTVSILGFDTSEYYDEFKDYIDSLDIDSLLDKRLVFYDGRLVDATMISNFKLIQIPEFSFEMVVDTVEEKAYMLKYAFDSYCMQFQDFVSEVYATTSILSPNDYEDAMMRIEAFSRNVNSQLVEKAIENYDYNDIVIEINRI